MDNKNLGLEQYHRPIFSSYYMYITIWPKLGGLQKEIKGGGQGKIFHGLVMGIRINVQQARVILSKGECYSSRHTQCNIRGGHPTCRCIESEFSAIYLLDHFLLTMTSVGQEAHRRTRWHTAAVGSEQMFRIYNSECIFPNL